MQRRKYSSWWRTQMNKFTEHNLRAPDWSSSDTYPRRGLSKSRQVCNGRGRSRSTREKGSIDFVDTGVQLVFFIAGAVQIPATRSPSLNRRHPRFHTFSNDFLQRLCLVCVPDCYCVSQTDLRTRCFDSSYRQCRRGYRIQ